MSEVNPNYNPQADFDNFGEEMEHIVKTTPKEVLKKEWDKVLAEYGTDTHDKILSMTDDFVQSNRSEGQTYAHYHYDMMADFALHILETFNTEECTFYPTMNTSSATICGACGKEKFEHNL